MNVINCYYYYTMFKTVKAGVYTMSQDVEEIDMETENFNFKWE